MRASIEKLYSKKHKLTGYAIRFKYNGKRRKFRIVGKPDQRSAQETCNRIDELLGLAAQGQGANERIGDWLAGLSVEQHAKVAKTTLVESREPEAEQEKPKTLAEHIADWHDWLMFKGNGDTHNRRTIRTVKRMLATAKVESIEGITTAVVAGIIKARRDSGAGLRTCNADLVAIKAFTKWAHDNGRLTVDPISKLSKYKQESDRRYERQALSPDELGRLFHAAATGPDKVYIGTVGKTRRQRRYVNMPGHERAMLYRVAAGTGFRRSELRRLTRPCFDLDSDRPAISLDAGKTKNKHDGRQPIRRDLADRLRPWLATKDRGAPVFNVPHNTAPMIRADLRRARALWIKEATDRNERRERITSDYLTGQDEAGRVVDFHALRPSYITNLVQSGASVKAAQELARHSTPTLTMNVYTKLGLHDLSSAVEAMQDHEREAIEERQEFATGTYDLPEKAGPYAGQQANATPRNEAQSGSKAGQKTNPAPWPAHKKTPCLQGVKSNSPGWIRTSNQVINSHSQLIANPIPINSLTIRTLEGGSKMRTWLDACPLDLPAELREQLERLANTDH